MRLSMAVLLLMFVTACKKTPRVGDACEPLQKGTVGCEDGATLLYCLDMKVRAVPCRGPKGCVKSVCDATLAREDEACETQFFGAPPNETCGDGIVLECKGPIETLGKWTTVKHCRGPKKCSAGFPPDCDQSYAEIGDVCTAAAACSVDGKKVLECDAGTFKERKDCAGSKGCVTRKSDILTVAYCDYADAAVGTACGKGNENLHLCTADGAALLVCDPQTMKFAVDTTCKKGERCSKESGIARCMPPP